MNFYDPGRWGGYLGSAATHDPLRSTLSLENVQTTNNSGIKRQFEKELREYVDPWPTG